MAEIKITKENFEDEVVKSGVPVLVDFWATWCGPCRMIAPIVEEIALENEGVLKVGKVNVDEQPELANAFRIDSIPSLILFKGGKVVSKAIGYRPKSEIEKMFK